MPNYSKEFCKNNLSKLCQKIYNKGRRVRRSEKMFNPEIIEGIQSKYASFSLYLNERTRRVWAGIRDRGKSIRIQPVEALRGTMDRNRKAGKKELCQHIP